MYNNSSLDSLLEYLNISPIELLGYAKNYILETKERVKNLPQWCQEMLCETYDMLDQIQDYLYLQ